MQANQDNEDIGYRYIWSIGSSPQTQTKARRFDVEEAPLSATAWGGEAVTSWFSSNLPCSTHFFKLLPPTHQAPSPCPRSHTLFTHHTTITPPSPTTTPSRTQKQSKGMLFPPLLLYRAALLPQHRPAKLCKACSSYRDWQSSRSATARREKSLHGGCSVS